MASDIETHLRQAKESGIGYDEFLLDLATTELQVRSEKSTDSKNQGCEVPFAQAR